MKKISISLACLFFSLSLFAQTEADSLLTTQEISFRDSIAAINQSNENLQLVQQTYNKATDFFANQQYAQAITAYTDVLNIDSVYINAFYNRGICYKELNRFEEAIADMDKVFILDSSNVDALIEKAIYFSLNNQRGEAKQAFEKINLRIDEFLK